ncbi:MAG: hypothetical protein KDK70_20110 [Myxococcales bacterium]|nr:hypothetical protein [Myxococcales bacterium]
MPPSTTWVRITKDEIQVGPSTTLSLHDHPPDDASLRDPQAPSPELISALESVYPLSSKTGPHRIMVIGTPHLTFTTLMMVLNSAGAAGFTTYAFTVENDDGTIPETQPESTIIPPKGI